MLVNVLYSMFVDNTHLLCAITLFFKVIHISWAREMA